MIVMLDRLKRCFVIVLLTLPASGETVFRRAMERVFSMDPADAASVYSAQMVQMVYETLLEFDYQARPYALIPGLAVAMPEVSSNGLVYLLSLKDDAQFQTDPCFGMDANGHARGRIVTAQDVVFSLKRLADRRVASPGSWVVEDTIVGMRAFAEASMIGVATDYALPVAGLNAVNDRTVRIELTRPMHQFIWYLAMAYTAVVPYEAVQKYGENFSSHAVGTGPYRLATWQRNHQITYERDRSWRGWGVGPAAVIGESAETIPFDRVIYRVIDDVSTQWLCFLAGELDFLGNVSRDNWDVVIDASGQLTEPLKRRGIVLHSIPTLEVAYVGFNMDDPVVGGNRVLRQALNCAFDSKAWVRFFNQRTIVCDGPVPLGIAGRLETPFAYASNFEKAKMLLAKAGYPGGVDPATGRRLELTMDLGRTSQDVRESTELMVSFMARVGVSLKPQYHNWPAFLRRVSSRQSQMFRIDWTGDYPDAENFLQLFHSRNVSPGPNRTNYINPSFDKVYETACATSDATQRNQYWAQAQEIIREDCPWLFLHYQKAFSLCQSNVRAYVPSDFPYGAEKYLRTLRK